MAMATGFYAVAKGRTPGIYLTWAECNDQVHDFSNAHFIKFNTECEALAFINANGHCDPGTSSNQTGVKRGSDGIQAGTSSKNSKIEPLKKVVELKTFGKYYFPVDNDGFVHVYVNEAIGSTKASFGLGVYFMFGHSLNTAQAVASNSGATIQAAILAIQLVKKHDIKKLQINTHSEYLIKAATSWIPKWKNNNWQKSSGGELKNWNVYQELDKQLTPDIELRWNDVAYNDEGDQAAQELADEGAQMYKDQLQN